MSQIIIKIIKIKPNKQKVTFTLNSNNNWNRNSVIANLSILLLNNNPNILRLKNKLVNYESTDKTITNYIKIYLDRPLDYYLSKYDPEIFPIYNLSLKQGWKSLEKYKNIPGIYKFTALFLNDSTDTYIGSTKNIYQRCYIQHKNHAFVNTKKHYLFYNKVVQNGWESFQLSILTIIPDYCIEFAKIYPEYIISKKDILILSDLVSLELTIAVRSQNLFRLF